MSSTGGGHSVTTLDDREWVREALRRIGRDDPVERVWRCIEETASEPDRLATAGVDSSRSRHRDVYYGVFANAGLDAELSDDGAAVEVGMPVLLVPPLRAVTERRLHHVIAIMPHRAPQ